MVHPIENTLGARAEGLETAGGLGIPGTRIRGQRRAAEDQRLAATASRFERGGTLQHLQVQLRQ